MIRRLIDMQASSEQAGPSAVQAYGTSEGVKKAWDTRGRVTDGHLAKASSIAGRLGDVKMQGKIENVRNDALSKGEFDQGHAKDLADLTDQAYENATNESRASRSSEYSRIGGKLFKAMRTIDPD